MNPASGRCAASAPDVISEWFIYYQIAPPDLPQVQAAVAAFQQQLCQDWPGLQARLLRRPTAHEGRLTLMEIYGFGPSAQPSPPADASPGVLSAIEQAARGIASWLQGERHVEVFQPCAW